MSKTPRTNAVLYPAPRWFRDTVNEWLDATPSDSRRARITDLWNRIVRAQLHLHPIDHTNDAALKKAEAEREALREQADARGKE